MILIFVLHMKVYMYFPFFLLQLYKLTTAVVYQYVNEWVEQQSLKVNKRLPLSHCMFSPCQQLTKSSVNPNTFCSLHSSCSLWLKLSYDAELRINSFHIYFANVIRKICNHCTVIIFTGSTWKLFITSKNMGVCLYSCMCVCLCKHLFVHYKFLFHFIIFLIYLFSELYLLWLVTLREKQLCNKKDKQCFKH